MRNKTLKALVILSLFAVHSVLSTNIEIDREMMEAEIELMVLLDNSLISSNKISLKLSPLLET